MVARLTPVQKVASSILVRPNLLASDAIFFCFLFLCVSAVGHAAVCFTHSTNLFFICLSAVDCAVYATTLLVLRFFSAVLYS